MSVFLSACSAISLAVSGVTLMPAWPKIRPMPGINRRAAVSSTAMGTAARAAYPRSVSASFLPSSIWRERFVAVNCAAEVKPAAPNVVTSAAGPVKGSVVAAAPATRGAAM
jgi:hypothetical protein